MLHADEKELKTHISTHTHTHKKRKYSIHFVTLKKKIPSSEGLPLPHANENSFSRYICIEIEIDMSVEKDGIL
jgi:hypothetical protein